MAVLVTGGAGYIGSHTVLALVESGEDVVVLDRLSTGFEWAVASEAVLYRGDVGDSELLRAIFKKHEIDSVIHLAGSLVVHESVLNPLDYYENNTAKSLQLIKAVLAAQVPNFVFSSTAAVYGTPTDVVLVDEDCQLRPISPYASSKLVVEIMLKDVAVAHPSFNYTALRYFNVAGSDPAGRLGQSTEGATHLLKLACEAALGKRESLDIFGTDYPTSDGTCVRDYVHVTDLADAHVKALQRMRNGGRPLVANCGYGRGFTVFEVVNCVKRVSGCDFKINLSSRRAGDAAMVVANSERARVELNWIPKLNDLETIVRTSLAWENRLQHRRRSYSRPML